MISVFLVYLCNKITPFETSNIKPLTSRSNVFCFYFIDFDLVSLNFQIPCVFPVFFPKIFRFPVFSLSGITFHHFPVFPVEWEPWAYDMCTCQFKTRSTYKVTDDTAGWYPQNEREDDHCSHYVSFHQGN